MTDIDQRLPAGTLPQRLAETVAGALASGALRPIATRQTQIEDAGVRFLVRVVDSLARKESALQRPPDAGTPADPFSPPDPRLTVGTLTETHVAVLNKFNVLSSHLLIVTRGFAHQETLLDPEDLAALVVCLREIDGLGFYNGGTSAGASQPHKHLQLVPLPLADEGPAVPMETLLLPGPGRTSAQPPFAHVFAPIDVLGSDPAALHRLYLRLLGQVGVRALARDGAAWQSAPYNLLVTRRWMLAVPRPAERVQGIWINGLAFAGSLFVKDRAQLETVRRLGPMRMLCAAASGPGGG
jgi:sulfate adenylyltransferase (ADP) / ATP adenylyltransferase